MATELLHVMNRGVDKRTIALDNRDRQRFVADLYMLNDSKPVDSLNYHFAISLKRGVPYRAERDRDPLVQIHAWILMGNHYHLLLSEMQQGGISRFLQKLNMGYAKYFNERHERTGALFQGRSKRVHIDTDAHYLWILHYIHLNALDVNPKTGNWRVQCPVDPNAALTWLLSYRWSSYRDYAGEKGFPELVEESFMFEERRAFTRELKRYLSSVGGTYSKELALE